MLVYRIEKDSMGEVKVLQDALYGAQTQRALDNFSICSQPMPLPFIQAMLQVKKAAAIANNRLQLLSDSDTQKIVSAIDSLLESDSVKHFPVPVFQTGSGTSTNMNVNEVIAHLASSTEHPLLPNDHINMGQSSNDVIPTALLLSTATKIKTKLLPALEYLTETIRSRGKQWKGVIKTGRTHLMDALPIPIEEELEAWALQIDECKERLQQDIIRLCRLPLGGTAVGSGVNSHPQFKQLATGILAKQTHLPCISAPSSYKGMSSLDTVVTCSGTLRTVAICLTKIANDLRWMNSGPLTGIADIKLAPLQPGSSIMPAKVNPVIPEAVLMACARVLGHDTTISLGAQGGNFQLNTMLPVVADSLLQSLSLLCNSALCLGEKAIATMEINYEKIEESLAQNPILVTALNNHIGYMKAAEIAKKAIQQKRSIREIALEETDLSAEQLDKLLDPSTMAYGNR